MTPSDKLNSSRWLTNAALLCFHYADFMFFVVDGLAIFLTSSPSNRQKSFAKLVFEAYFYWEFSWF
jgi:hypothetical protein